MAYSHVVEVGIGLSPTALPLITSWASPTNEAVAGVHVGFGADPANIDRFDTRIHLDFVVPEVRVIVHDQLFYADGGFQLDTSAACVPAVRGKAKQQVEVSTSAAGAESSGSARTGRVMRTAFAEKRFLCLWSGQVTSMLGDQMVPIALVAWIIQSRGHSASSLGLILAGRALAMALFVPIGGVVADRYSRPRVMVVCDMVRVAAMLGLVMVPTDTPVLQLAGLTFVLGAGEAFFRPAFQALTPTLVPPDRLAWANSMNSIATTTSGLLGPVLGGTVVAAVDYRAALIVNLATFLCSTAALLALGRKIGSLPPNDVRRSLYAEALEGMRAVAARRWVWAVLAIDVSHILLAVAPWLVLLPTISAGHYGPRGYGLLMAAFAAGGLCGGLIAMRHRPRRPGLSALLAQALFVFPLLTLVPGGLSLWVLIVPYVVAGAGSEYNTVLWMSALHRTFPDQLMGRVLALSSLASTMLMPIGMAVTGTVAAVVGSSTLLVSGAVVIVVTTAAALTVPGVNRFADPPIAAVNNSTGSIGVPAAEEARHHGDS